MKIETKQLKAAALATHKDEGEYRGLGHMWYEGHPQQREESYIIASTGEIMLIQHVNGDAGIPRTGIIPSVIPKIAAKRDLIEVHNGCTTINEMYLNPIEPNWKIIDWRRPLRKALEAENAKGSIEEWPEFNPILLHQFHKIGAILSEVQPAKTPSAYTLVRKIDAPSLILFPDKDAIGLITPVMHSLRLSEEPKVEYQRKFNLQE